MQSQIPRMQFGVEGGKHVLLGQPKLVTQGTEPAMSNTILNNIL